MSVGSGLYVAGTGRLGLAVARLARRRGVRVVGVWNHRPLPPGRRELAGDLPLVVSPEPPRVAADVWLVAVPDDAVTDVAAALAGAEGPLPAVAAHCAGARPIGLLGPLAERGVATGSWHPAMTFRGTAGDEDALGRAWAAIGGGSRAAASLESLSDRLGLRSIVLEPEHRVRYHTALVLASNGRVALDAAAVALLEDAGLDDNTARRLLAPLVERTDENLRDVGPVAALTGPTARGDAGTVRAQIEILADRPDAHEAYRALARLALALVPPDARGPGHERVADLLESNPATTSGGIR